MEASEELRHVRLVGESTCRGNIRNGNIPVEHATCLAEPEFCDERMHGLSGTGAEPSSKVRARITGLTCQHVQAKRLVQVGLHQVSYSLQPSLCSSGPVRDRASFHHALPAKETNGKCVNHGIDVQSVFTIVCRETVKKQMEETAKRSVMNPGLKPYFTRHNIQLRCDGAQICRVERSTREFCFDQKAEFRCRTFWDRRKGTASLTVRSEASADVSVFTLRRGGAKHDEHGAIHVMRFTRSGSATVPLQMQASPAKTAACVHHLRYPGRCGSQCRKMCGSLHNEVDALQQGEVTGEHKFDKDGVWRTYLKDTAIGFTYRFSTGGDTDE